MRVGVDRTKYQIHIPLPAKIDPSVTMMTVEEKPDVTYNDIGGSKEQIEKMREVVELPLLHPEKFVKLGIDPPKGVLCYGPPGTGARPPPPRPIPQASPPPPHLPARRRLLCVAGGGAGKTLLARAVANRTDACFIRVIGSELVQKYVGEGARMVRELFQMARTKKACLIFFDEARAPAPRPPLYSAVPRGAPRRGAAMRCACMYPLSGGRDRRGPLRRWRGWRQRGAAHDARNREPAGRLRRARQHQGARARGGERRMPPSRTSVGPLPAQRRRRALRPWCPRRRKLVASAGALRPVRAVRRC